MIRSILAVVSMFGLAASFATSQEAAPTAANIGFEPMPGPGPEPDPVPLPQPLYPPIAVSDLVGSDPTPDGLTLSWTAPDDTTDGANGDHIAELYDIRYSLTPIDPATFDGATPLEGEPAPQSAGAFESFVVTGLQPDAWYYFALRSQDESGLWSGVSNVVYLQTVDIIIPPNPGTGPEPSPEAQAGRSGGGSGSCSAFALFGGGATADRSGSSLPVSHALVLLAAVALIAGRAAFK